ncbi:MAG: Ldh family oxidoreductase [Chloroflexi bacterium]|nr:Ldh family oxidoreductase [Chloroflexota bacterium]
MALDFLKFTDENSVRVRATDLHRQVSAILRAVNVPGDHAETTAKILTKASLMAVDSHGVGNAVRYAESIESGQYTVPQKVDVISESDTTALLTCGDGLGFVAAHRAMEMSIEKAKAHGVGMATVRDGHHIGMVGYYPLMAIEQNMIGMAVTNASPAMRPALGAAPRLGTNPIAFGAPAGEERPFLLDMATTTVASGKLGLARRLGVPIPVGWAVTAEGQPLTHPPETRGEHWSQNPLGNTREQGAHKGYGLAVMVDILAGVLSGGGFGTQLTGGENMSWTMAIDISKFRPLDEFKSMMDEMIRELHATPAEPGEERVLVAGDPEWDAEEERSAKGVPLHNSQYDEMRACAQRLNAELFI